MQSEADVSWTATWTAPRAGPQACRCRLYYETVHSSAVPLGSTGAYDDYSVHFIA